ncbi:fungal-specific transcription factor domain-containing protein [Biscogniauxia sp. FL1348]|nr:fungal-specific transcription factor domain-containing protein [Biscogniauxia sp. FL1348]
MYGRIQQGKSQLALLANPPLGCEARAVGNLSAPESLIISRPLNVSELPSIKKTPFWALYIYLIYRELCQAIITIPYRFSISWIRISPFLSISSAYSVMETSSKRKACDLCYKKKIRCDGLKPSCSNCRLYKVPCGTTTVRRKSGAALHKPTAASSPESIRDHKGFGSLEARLARIEAKLDNLRNSSQDVSVEGVLQDDSADSDSRTTESLGEIPLQLDKSSTWTHPGRSYEEPNVPPLTEALPVVETYFRDYNSAIPLFDQRSFMRMLDGYYSQSGEEKSRGAVGAAINIVLAFGYRMRYAGRGNMASVFGHKNVRKCIDNAQRMLGDLMVRDEDTLGVQVLLGLVLLFQANSDQQPSAVLSSTAMRLAHRLHLHSKTAMSRFPPDEARQRRNIFWICYYLDKDICLRTRTPSMQLDSDVDIDLPGSGPDESDDCFQSTDGLSNLHYLRARVKLANIQGRIYDSLFSNRSKKQSADARQGSVVYLDRLLDQWQRAIPESLRLECVTNSLEKAPLLHMITLYQTYILCLAMTHGLYSLDAPWLKSLGNLAALSLESFDSQSPNCMMGQLPPLPYAWEKCVVTSRVCLEILSDEAHLDTYHAWLNVCTYFCAFVFVLANASYSPSHRLAVYDRELVQTSMPQMEKLLDQNSSVTYEKLRLVLAGLENAATKAALGAKKSDKWARGQAQAVSSLYHDSSPQGQEVVSDTVVNENTLDQSWILADESPWADAPDVLDFTASDLDFVGFDFSRNV